MANIGDFNLKDMVDFTAALRTMGLSAAGMEEVADRIVHYLYENLVDSETEEKNCVLVRFFKTHPYNELDNELQEFASGILNGPSISPDMKCLVLLATVGTEAAWNSRKNSQGHKAIPLPSEEFVNGFPMFMQLILQIGVEVDKVLRPDPAVVMDMAQTTYSVFCISDAVGNSYVPVQQDFVIPYGIKSVIGFGGILPSGSFFATILFSRVAVSQQTAELFKSLALGVKIAILPFDNRKIFK